MDNIKLQHGMRSKKIIAHFLLAYLKIIKNNKVLKPQLQNKNERKWL
jgi:hypothetical protein